MKLGSFQSVPIQERPNRLSMLLWGPSGAGKTTLAATAPGKKLLINFDPDGPSSIAFRNDVEVIDLSGQLSSVGNLLDNMGMQLRAGLDEYDTVIVDSLTNVSLAALYTGIGKSKGATYDKPSQGAYQVRNNRTMKFMLDVLTETGAKNKHCIFVAHEDVPNRNDEGTVMSISIMLGGKLPTQGPVSISEVWAVYDNGKQRQIAVRPCRARVPMKTRMFDASKSPEFIWRYDAIKDEGEGLADWYGAWQEAKYHKIELPA